MKNDNRKIRSLVSASLIISVVISVCSCAHASLPGEEMQIHTLPESTIPKEATISVSLEETTMPEEMSLYSEEISQAVEETPSVESAEASVVTEPSEEGIIETETTERAVSETERESSEETTVSESVTNRLSETISENSSLPEADPTSDVETVASIVEEHADEDFVTSEEETESDESSIVEITEATSDPEETESPYPVPYYYPLDISECKRIADSAIRQAILDTCSHHVIDGYDENWEPMKYYFQFDDSLMANQQKRADTANEAGVITHAPMEGTFLPDSESCCSMLAVFDYLGSQPRNEWYFQGWPKESQDYQEIYDDFYTFVYNSAYMLVTVHGENLSREDKYLYFGYGFSMIAVPDQLLGMEMPLYAMEIYVGANYYRDPWWD
ncbi:MAG: hypothetical protein IK020_02135 [Clostridiales bacterium]|nr:hypothetical protein [Clostridiales bacterium]